MPSKKEQSNKSKWLKTFYERPEKLGHAIGFDKLVTDHGQWVRYLWENKTDEERGIQGHRNSYKTTSCVVLGCIWKLLFCPQYTILLVREEIGNAISTVMEITDKYNNNLNLQTIYHEIYGIYPFVLKRENQKSIVLPTKTDVGREGNIDAGGLMTSYTGRHYDWIHTDDIITQKDRVSQAKRDLTKRTLSELRNVKQLETGMLSHTGTPWHKSDEWKDIPNVLKFPIGKVNIPFIMKDLDKAKNHFRRGKSASLYAANYELKHIADEDSLFTDSKWLDIMPKNYEPIGHIDAAYKGKDLNAMTLIQEMDVTYKGKLYENQLVVTGFCWEGNIMDLFPKIKSIINRLLVGTVHIESNADKGFSAKEIREFHPTVSEYHESTNKHVKIVTHLNKHWHRIWFTPETMPEYVDQIMDYQEGQEPDDCPDGLSSILRNVFDDTEIVDDEFAISDTSYINDDGRDDY